MFRRLHPFTFLALAAVSLAQSQELRIADALSAMRPGDTLTVYVYGEPVSMTVKGVVSGGGPVGSEPTLLLHLDKAQELFGREGSINSIVVSNKGDEYDGAEVSEEVTKTLRVLFTDRETAVQLKEALAHPEVLEQLQDREQSPGISDALRQNLVLLQAELSMPDLSDELVSLFSDDEVRSVRMAHTHRAQTPHTRRCSRYTKGWQSPTSANPAQAVVFHTYVTFTHTQR